MSDVCQENNLSRKIINLISKLKLVKPTKQSVIMNDIESPIETVQSTASNEIDSSVEDIENQNNNDIEEGNSPKKFKEFCYEIEKFLNFLNNNENLNIYIHQYPQLLQKRLNINVDELQDLLAEVKDAMINIKKLKSQYKLIKKEISTVKRSIPRIKDIEIRELEILVSRYDKDLYTRWVKSKWKSDTIEELMFDVQEKKLAIDSLTTLITRYLEKAKKNNLFVNDQAEGKSSKNEKSESLSSMLSSISSKLPIPPPLPPPIPVTQSIPTSANASNSNNFNQSWVQRRFRAERRGGFGIRPITENSENEQPHVLSISLNNNARSNTSSSVNAAQSAESLRIVNNFNENMRRNSSSNNRSEIYTCNTRPVDGDSDIKSEIQSVLQALLRQRDRPLMITNG